MSQASDIAALIARLRAAGEAADFRVEVFAQARGYPFLGMTRSSTTTSAARHIYLSSGIHGDEPAGPQALLELLEADALPRTHHYYLCPLLNPTGLAAATRENDNGIDLNRDYRDFVSDEIRAHARWIEANISELDAALHLHEDWESQGFYLYELNFTDQPGYAERILEAARSHLPIETAEEIDGRTAKDGIIRPETIPEIEEGHPEAIYIQKKYGGLNYTLETPSSLDFRHRVEAHKSAISVIL